MSAHSDKPEYLHKLDLDKPGLFIARINCHVPQEQLNHMTEIMKKYINKFSPESEVMILGPDFEPVIMPDDETMKRLGWGRIEVIE